MIIISLVAIAMNLLSGFLNKKLVYTSDFIEKRKEIERIKKEYEEAKRAGDEKRVRKLEKRIQMAKKMEAELSLKAFRPIIVTFIIFWLMWGWLNSIYAEMGAFIILPFPLPLIGIVSNYFWWYFISSVAFAALTRQYFQPS